MGASFKSPAGRIALLLMLAGLALRLACVDAYTAYWPDETHQYLEQAHRLLTGVGLVPWEYLEGLRSRLLPLLLAGPMAAGHALGGAWGGIVAARGLVFIAALSIMPAAWAIGRRVSAQHGLAALAAAALWAEIVVWSAHVLSETLALAAFLVAAALLMARPRTMRGAAAAGALLAFATLMRVSSAPAFALFALLVVQRDGRAWGALVAGALPVLGLSAAVDLAFGQWPFEWVWLNLLANRAGGATASFGTQPWWWYLQAIWVNWSVALPILLIGVLKAPRAMRPLIWTALANLAVHMAIGHKEYRYIALTQALLVIVSAAGWVSAIREERFRAYAWIGSSVLIASLSAAMATKSPEEWSLIRESTMPRLEALAARDPASCGIALVGPGVWAPTRHVMDRDVPLYLFHRTTIDDVKGRAASAYNRIVAAPSFAMPGYAATGACNGDGAARVCLFARGGGCAANAASAAHEIQAYRRSFRH